MPDEITSSAPVGKGGAVVSTCMHARRDDLERTELNRRLLSRPRRLIAVRVLAVRVVVVLRAADEANGFECGPQHILDVRPALARLEATFDRSRLEDLLLESVVAARKQREHLGARSGDQGRSREIKGDQGSTWEHAAE